MLDRSRTAWILRRYEAGSNAGSGGLAMGSSGIEAGGPLPLYPGDLSDVFDVRALLTETKDSFSSLSEFLELRLKSPMSAERGPDQRGIWEIQEEGEDVNNKLAI